MSNFTGLKDTDLLIMQKMNDRDLFNFCLINKEAENLCNNENFWRNRYYSVYGDTGIEKKNNKTWKQRYLSTYFLIIETGYLQRLKYMPEFNIAEELNILEGKSRKVYYKKQKNDKHSNIWNTSKFKEAEENNLYIDISSGKYVTLKDALNMWKYNNKNYLYVPGLRVAGEFEDINRFFTRQHTRQGVPLLSTADLFKHIHQAYRLEIIEKAGDIKENFDREFAKAGEIKSEPSIINQNAVCVVTFSDDIDDILVFNETATYNFYETYKNVERGSEEADDFWVFRIDDDNQISEILNEIYNLKYAELYGIRKLKNRSKLNKNIEEVPTDNLQIKSLHIDAESG